jgi:hypothetical protein
MFSRKISYVYLCLVERLVTVAPIRVLELMTQRDPNGVICRRVIYMFANN